MNCIHCLVHKDNSGEFICNKKRHKFCPTYKVTYTGGGGEEYNDGTWIVDRTKKIITTVKLFDYLTGVFKMHDVGFRTRIGTGTGNPIKEDDGYTFIVYFLQAGTPYYFEPIK